MKLVLILWIAAMINVPAERHYVTTGTAINDHEFVTSDGNVWGVYDVLDVGESYTVVFDNNGTQSAVDDRVLKILRRNNS